ncbi:MAG TPA: hypothetical protein VLA76_02800 [Candidatus Angelobacter sp.]|nr:hypothetical protein [Candidatus Angelobacter sp.]
MRARASQRPYNVEYYRRNRELELQRVRVRQAGMVELLRDLRRVPCADCGRRFRPYQMDFDHRDPTTKAFNVMTGRAMLMSTAKVLAEVAKCDIVCVNCHRLRTRDMERGRVRRPAGAPMQLARLERWRDQAGLLNRLRQVPCADCGGRYEPCAMDFDHRDPTTKNHTVTRMVGRSSTEVILAEVAKCDIVCANCHRLRTWRRAGRE